MNSIKTLFGIALTVAFILSCHNTTTPAPDAATVDALPHDGGVVWDDAGVTKGEAIVWEVHYSPAVAPDTGCTEAVVALIESATTTLRLQAYGFTSQPIADALVRAHVKKVDVQLVLDRSDRTAHGSKAADMKTANIPVLFDAKHAIMHDKVIIVDGHIVETGSFNYTLAAQSANAENCIILHEDPASPALANKYLRDWQLHHDHSDL